jgi:hypothetical protein
MRLFIGSKLELQRLSMDKRFRVGAHNKGQRK